MKLSDFSQRLGVLGAVLLSATVLGSGEAFAVSPTIQGAWPPAAFPSNAIHYYVSPTGSDGSSSNGSSSSPWLTINHASSSIPAGSSVPIVVHVRPGTYKLPACSSASSITTSKSGTAAAPITFISDSRWQAKIVGDPSCKNQWFITGSYVNVWGFDLTGIQTSSNLNSAVIAVESSNGNVDVAYNHIHDLPYGFGSAISMEPWGNSTYTGAPCSVHDNVIHDIAFNATAAQHFNNYGMYIACGKTSYVYNNLIYNQGTIGIHLWHAANGVNIFNNTISSNNTEPTNQSIGILVGTGDGGGQTGAVYNVSNNIVVNSHYGIVAEYGQGTSISTSSVFQNNLIYNNAIDWYCNANGNVTTIQKYGMSVTGTIALTAQDPLFVSPANTDYHLKSGSKAINAGITSGAPTRDLELNARVLPVDIGAYEFAGTSASPTPSPSPTAAPKPVLSLSASSLNFGSVIIGSSSASQTLTIKNAGNANLSIKSDFTFSSGFSGSGNCYVAIPIAPGASCSVNIAFKPTIAGSYNGSFTIVTNASSAPVAVSLAGVGASPAAPVLSLSASSLSFGRIKVGRTSPAQTLTLKNTGNANLAITSAFVLSSGFDGHGNCPVGTLAPGASCYVNITFKPASIGTKTGSIQIYTNASSPAKAVPLSGTGK